MDKLRESMIAFLNAHRVCVFAASGPQGARLIPVRYYSQGLQVDCLLPRWADALHYLEHDQRVMLVVQEGAHDEPVGNAHALRWLQLLGTACPLEKPEWGQFLPQGALAPPLEGLYQVARVTPQHIDLVDESRGWGARHTLDL